MKEFLKLYTKKIVLRIVVKYAIIGGGLLIWNYVTERGTIQSLLETPFFVAGIVMLVLAWINYLNLDGSVMVRQKINVGFLDVGNGSYAPMDMVYDQQVVKVWSNGLTGVFLLLPSIVMAVIG